MKLLKLKLKPEHNKTFQNWVTLMDGILDDVNFVIQSDGIHVRTQDSSRVSQIETLFDSGHFDNWEYDMRFVGTDLGYLLKILKNLKPDAKSVMTLILDEKTFTIEVKKNGRTMKLGFELYDLGTAQIPQVKLKMHKAYYSLKAKPFLNSIKIADKFFNHLRFQGIVDDSLKLSATSDTKFWEFLDILPVKEGEVKEESNGMYSLGYLKTLKTMIKLDDEIDIGFSSAMPIAVKLRFSACSYYDFYLAPRVET